MPNTAQTSMPYSQEVDSSGLPSFFLVTNQHPLVRRDALIHDSVSKLSVAAGFEAESASYDILLTPTMCTPPHTLD
jgi:hypothetical protein